MNSTVTPDKNNDTHNPINQVAQNKILVTGGVHPYEVQWDPEAKVTTMGSLVFFAPYLQAGGLMGGLCDPRPGSLPNHCPVDCPGLQLVERLRPIGSV